MRTGQTVHGLVDSPPEWIHHDGYTSKSSSGIWCHRLPPRLKPSKSRRAFTYAVLLRMYSRPQVFLDQSVQLSVGDFQTGANLFRSYSTFIGPGSRCPHADAELIREVLNSEQSWRNSADLLCHCFHPPEKECHTYAKSLFVGRYNSEVLFGPIGYILIPIW